MTTEELRRRFREGQALRDAEYLARREAAKEYDAWAKAHGIAKEWHNR